ncbi:MAG TPA: hypothetical protein DIV79_10930 [Opitutae bacterium]|nr:hypothetical protein [Opitutaceae bacterium]HCR30520.1 hypothetical protein [Opitutae bacterium]
MSAAHWGFVFNASRCRIYASPARSVELLRRFKSALEASKPPMIVACGTPSEALAKDGGRWQIG